MSPPTTPTDEAQAPVNKLQAKQGDSFYAALNEDQRQVVDKTMEHTMEGVEPRVGDPVKARATTGDDHGETEPQRVDDVQNPRVLQVVRGGDAETATGDVSNSADPMRRTNAHHAEEELSTEDLLSQIRSLRTAIEIQVSGIDEATGRGRSTVRSGSQRGSSNFFVRLEQCKQLLKQAQESDAKLSAKLSENCATARDGGGSSGQIETGIWASSRGDMGKFQATVRASAEEGLRFYQTLGTMTTRLAKEIGFDTRPEVYEANESKTGNGGSNGEGVGYSRRGGRVIVTNNSHDTAPGETAASGENTAPERRVVFDKRTASTV